MGSKPSDDIPDLAGKVIFVTDGTDGFGKESIRKLCLHGPAHIYLAARSRAKAEAVLEEFKKQYPGHAPITFIDLDLNSFSSITIAAHEFLSTSGRLNILMCNAGLTCVKPKTTVDGYELNFGVNHLGHAMLVKLLMPLLLETEQQFDTDVRVITLSSADEKMAPKHYTFDRMKSDLEGMGVMTRYGQSKLANIQYTRSLAKRYPSIVFASVRPGNVRTNFGAAFFEGRPLFEKISRAVVSWFLTVFEVDIGARCQLWAAIAPRDNVISGEFYHPVGVLGKGSRRSNDEEMAEELWDWTQQQLDDYVLRYKEAAFSS